MQGQYRVCPPRLTMHCDAAKQLAHATISSFRAAPFPPLVQDKWCGGTLEEAKGETARACIAGGHAVLVRPPGTWCPDFEYLPAGQLVNSCSAHYDYLSCRSPPTTASARSLRAVSRSSSVLKWTARWVRHSVERADRGGCGIHCQSAHDWAFSRQPTLVRTGCWLCIAFAVPVVHSNMHAGSSRRC